eukprot:9055123-Prorocentrum_lima.AAC.1
MPMFTQNGSCPTPNMSSGYGGVDHPMGGLQDTAPTSTTSSCQEHGQFTGVFPPQQAFTQQPVSYTHLRAHETRRHL